MKWFGIWLMLGLVSLDLPICPELPHGEHFVENESFIERREGVEKIDDLSIGYCEKYEGIGKGVKSY